MKMKRMRSRKDVTLSRNHGTGTSEIANELVFWNSLDSEQLYTG